MNDYKTITVQDDAATMLGQWWKRPPHQIREGSYAKYKGEGIRPVEVKARILACGPSNLQWYSPSEEPDLIDAFLDVAQRRLTPVEFADRYGLLGYNSIVPRENACPGGDPLDWFTAHALTAYTIATLLQLISEAKESSGGRKNLADYLKDGISSGPYGLGGATAEVSFRQSSASPNLVANGILRWLLNKNLGEAGRKLQSSKYGLRSMFTFRSLLEAIYWQLADRIGQSTIHRCLSCGRIFTHSNIRARFCPPIGGKKISKCKSRYNVREFRKNKKKQSRRKKR